MKNTLQANGAMKLVLCDCGKLHVTLGSVTLHFTRNEFQKFAESIGRLAAIVGQSAPFRASAGAGSSLSEGCH
ncbi:MAG: hypothetical protein CV088_14135 [Nitrospira sp. LK70]|nr:hypothetical protein [Nitrospira sp. LK70]